MVNRADFFGWQHDFLAFKRQDVSRFDLGLTALPFSCRLRPCKLAGTICAGLVGFPVIGGAVFFSWLPFDGEFGTIRLIVCWMLALGLLVTGSHLLVSAFVGRRQQIEIWINRDRVEVRDRPPLGKPKEWSEPLANYTGVRYHVVSTRVSTTDNTMDFAAHAIDLDHSDEARIIPLLRTDRDENVEQRWAELAKALGKPQLGTFDAGTVKCSMFGIPLRK